MRTIGAIGLACIIGAAPAIEARTIKVPKDYPTIQMAIDGAEDGDVIEVKEGVYREILALSGKSITIRSSGCPCGVVVDAEGRGAALSLAGPGDATIEGLRLTGGFDAHGGGIRILGDTSPTIRGSCVTDNVAGVAGGGIAILGGPGMARIENTLVAKNRAPEGAGILLEGPVAAVIVNDTIADNIADVSAGGIVNRGGQPVIFNAILWGNLAGGEPGDVEGVVPPMIGFSTIGDGQFDGTNGIDRLDPLFEDAPAGNYRIPSDSPAVDSGVAEYEGFLAPEEDFEGSPRYDEPLAPNTNGGRHDKGMDEVSPAFIRGDANVDGKVDIADPIYTLSYVMGSGIQPRCLNAMDMNDSGAVDIADPCFMLEYLFRSGDPMPSPFPKVGLDDTKPEVSCSAYRPCGW
ncbi:MAG: hypothetical protein JXP34_16095 [Planctomycetes bacterium]|nr:hypothetical protein [Planctomycetota bacterium]